MTGYTVAASSQQPSAADASNGNSREAFILSSTKGIVGHSEAGAGVTGLLDAVFVMQQQAVAPMLHLRELNPYVAQPLSTRSLVVNRATGLAPIALSQTTESATMTMGVSSFGAQGTNAHAIIEHRSLFRLPASSVQHAVRSSGIAGVGGGQLMVLDKHKTWVTPTYQSLVTRVLVRKPLRAADDMKVCFEANLQHSPFSYMWQYISLPMAPGQSKVPFLSNSVLLGLTVSVAGLLTENVDARDSNLLLNSMVLAPPQQLPTHPGHPGVVATVLLAAVDLQTGKCVIDLEGQRQLQCYIADAQTPPVLHGSPGVSLSDCDDAVVSGVRQLFGTQLPAQAAAAVAGSKIPPAALVSAQHKPDHLTSFATLQDASSTPGCSSNSTAAAHAYDYRLHPTVLESCLQSCMLDRHGIAAALWLSAVQSVHVPHQSGTASSAAKCWASSKFTLTGDGSTGHIQSLNMTTGNGALGFCLRGGLLAADAVAAAEAAAISMGQASTHVSAPASAAASLVAAVSNPLLELEPSQRGLYLQAQIMMEVSLTLDSCTDSCTVQR